MWETLPSQSIAVEGSTWVAKVDFYTDSESKFLSLIRSMLVILSLEGDDLILKDSLIG